MNTRASLLKFIGKPKVAISLTALLLLSLGLGKVYFSNGQLISGDGVYYYAQTRSLLKDMDWSFSNELELYQPSHTPRVRHFHPETGKLINKYPIGSSLLWLPFLTIAHVTTSIIAALGWPIDQSGYGLIDQVFLLLGSVFYFLCSALFLVRIAAFILPSRQKPLYLGLGFLCLSTALYYCAVEPAMSHIPSLFTVSLFILLSLMHIRQKPNITQAFLYGGVAGLMILVRNQNALFLLLPLIYLTRTRNYQWKHYVFAFLAGSLVLLPQLIYWKYIYNEWLLYSYQGERFGYWNAPKILEVLFSLKSGFLTWHPIHFLSLAGLVFLAIYNRKFTRIFFLLFLLQLYIFSSWQCWWLGDSFGYRGLANGLPLLFPGFVWGYEKAIKKGYAYGFLATCILLLSWNIYLTLLYAAGKIPHSGPLLWTNLFSWIS